MTKQGMASVPERTERQISLKELRGLPWQKREEQRRVHAASFRDSNTAIWYASLVDRDENGCADEKMLKQIQGSTGAIYRL